MMRDKSVSNGKSHRLSEQHPNGGDVAFYSSCIVAPISQVVPGAMSSPAVSGMQILDTSTRAHYAVYSAQKIKSTHFFFANEITVSSQFCGVFEFVVNIDLFAY
jgi:hypothetical protein